MLSTCPYTVDQLIDIDDIFRDLGPTDTKLNLTELPDLSDVRLDSGPVDARPWSSELASNPPIPSGLPFLPSASGPIPSGLPALPSASGPTPSPSSYTLSTPSGFSTHTSNQSPMSNPPCSLTVANEPNYMEMAKSISGHLPSEQLFLMTMNFHERQDRLMMAFSGNVTTRIDNLAADLKSRSEELENKFNTLREEIQIGFNKDAACTTFGPFRGLSASESNRFLNIMRIPLQTMSLRHGLYAIVPVKDKGRTLYVLFLDVVKQLCELTRTFPGITYATLKQICKSISTVDRTLATRAAKKAYAISGFTRAANQYAVDRCSVYTEQTFIGILDMYRKRTEIDTLVHPLCNLQLGLLGIVRRKGRTREHFSKRLYDCEQGFGITAFSSSPVLNAWSESLGSLFAPQQEDTVWMDMSSEDRRAYFIAFDLKTGDFRPEYDVKQPVPSFEQVKHAQRLRQGFQIFPFQDGKATADGAKPSTCRSSKRRKIC